MSSEFFRRQEIMQTMTCQNCGAALDPQQVAQTGRCYNCGTPVSVAPGMSGPAYGSQPQMAMGGQPMGQPMMMAGAPVVAVVQSAPNSGKANTSMVLGILGAVGACAGFFIIRGLKAVNDLASGTDALCAQTGQTCNVSSVSTGSIIFFTILFLILPLLGIIFGHLSLKDIAARAGQLGGRGMGIAGLACSYAAAGAILLSLVLPG